MKRAFAAACALAVAAFGACTAELGPLPATCDASAGAEACPEGYECIRGVCAEPGTPIPITVTTLQYLRDVDLHLVPDGGGALVAWQVYQYDLELHDFAGARLAADGATSAPFSLVAGYPADANYLEPYFDVLPAGDGLLLAVGAAPVDELSPSRLTQFSVRLPAPGSEASGSSSTRVWELRMRTLGYGAVSVPSLARTASGVRLAYVESIADVDETRGELAVFSLDEAGDRVDPPAECTEGPCCQANSCGVVRASSSVAVGVFDALIGEADPYWVIDDARPSVVRQSPPETAGEPDVLAEAQLPRLAVPVALRGSDVVYLTPSTPRGVGLPDDPVDGPASLWTVALDPVTGAGEPTKIGDLPGVRPFPRPAWITRADRPALLVTPGTSRTAPDLLVYAVDVETGAATQVATIPRYSTLPVSGVRALVNQGKLFVTWLDESPDVATIRATVIAEP